jgi:hypothetical protein
MSNEPRMEITMETEEDVHMSAAVSAMPVPHFDGKTVARMMYAIDETGQPMLAVVFTDNSAMVVKAVEGGHLQIGVGEEVAPGPGLMN